MRRHLKENNSASHSRNTTDKPHTISNVSREQDLEIFLDIRIKQLVEIEAIRFTFPLCEICELVAMNDIALGAELGDVAYFGVDCGEEEARVSDVAIGDVGGAVVPREAHTGVNTVRVDLAALALVHL